jgi:hypothetical protein
MAAINNKATRGAATFHPTSISRMTVRQKVQLYAAMEKANRGLCYSHIAQQ